MLKIFAVIALFAASVFAVNITGQVTPADSQYAALGSHIYIQLVDGATMQVLATAHPNPFGYYAFGNVTGDYVNYLVIYPGKVEGYQLNFEPTMYVLFTEGPNIETVNRDFVWTAQQE